MKLSIVMPYFGNGRTVRQSLESYARQEGVADSDYELILVDDGSPDPAEEAVDGLSLPYSLRVIRQPNAGQSAATNRGIDAARGEVVHLSCPDILACSTLLRQHLEAHAAASDPIVVQGQLPYAPLVPATPFHDYLMQGRQFGFGLIRDPERIDPTFLYAPNVSARRSTLQQVGGFDPKFRYGFQDTDLGIRLMRAGVRLVYRRDAVGYHDHPTDLPAFVRRELKVGEGQPRMMRKHRAFRGDPTGEKAADWLRKAALLAERFETLFCGALQIEGKLGRRPIPTSLRDKLFQLYTGALEGPRARGAVENLSELRSQVSMSRAELRAIRERIVEIPFADIATRARSKLRASDRSTPLTASCP